MEHHGRPLGHDLRKRPSDPPPRLPALPPPGMTIFEVELSVYVTSPKLPKVVESSKRLRSVPKARIIVPMYLEGENYITMARLASQIARSRLSVKS